MVIATIGSPVFKDGIGLRKMQATMMTSNKVLRAITHLVGLNRLSGLFFRGVARTQHFSYPEKSQ
jgi:hypothetical protein